ncbi:carboxypeptidase regulatory-like domain-containing protein [Planctomicrobium sp. SH668]|uniref:carboxypeptidase regulatory-like domain-containing protein n=1 Tax=Planctomicrobium sp. SH668 TaxID=3448126 RepID=UPI003F5BC172
MKFQLLSLALVASCLWGCGSSTTPSLAQVKGKVVIDGKPASGVYVQFSPENGRLSSGTTNAEGVYSLTYTPEAQGALPGKHTVNFNVPPTANQKADSKIPKLKENANEMEIKNFNERYNQPVRIAYSQQVEVKKGNQEIDFDLSGKLGESK